MSARRVWLVTALVGAASLVTAVSTATPANALSRKGVKGIVALNAIACQTSDHCVAVGSDINGNGKSVIITTATGAVRAWSGDLKNGAMQGVACASSSKCIAISGNTAASVSTLTGAMVVKATVTPPPTGIAALGSIACASHTTCYAVGFYGTELASRALVVRLSANGTLLGTTKSSSRGIGAIACSTSTICLMAVANRTGPERIQLLRSGHFGTTHNLPANTYVQAMSCYKAALCYALAGTKSSGLSDKLFSLNPKTGAVGTMITLPGLHGDAIACSSTSRCQVLGFKVIGPVARSGVIAVSHGKAGAFKDYPGSLSDIACPTATVCDAVGTSSGKSVIDRI